MLKDDLVQLLRFVVEKADDPAFGALSSGEQLAVVSSVLLGIADDLPAQETEEMIAMFRKCQTMTKSMWSLFPGALLQ